MSERDFSPGKPVRNPYELYGWNRPDSLLDILSSDALSGVPFWLFGERLSGKTSVLLCVKNRIEASGSNFGVIVDFQEFYSRGQEYSTANSYRHILEVSFKRLLETGLWDKRTLKSLLEDDGILDTEPDNASRWANAMKKMADMLQEKNKALVLLFDDAEKLPDFFPNNNNYFYIFRDFGHNWRKGEGGVTYALAGAIPLADLKAKTPGSSQFDGIKDPRILAPLNEEEFEELWKDIENSLSEESRRNLRVCIDRRGDARQLCGGWPAFAKILAHAWKDATSAENSNPLENDLEHILKRHAASRAHLARIARDLSAPGINARHLIDCGLLVENDPDIGGYSINGELLKLHLRKFPDPREQGAPVFKDAGELGAWLVEHDLLPALLSMLGGEHEDWLEFKGEIWPDQEHIEADNKARGSRQTLNDWLWNIARAMLAMRNSRGGLILVGIGDKGEILGVNTHDNSDTDYRRKIREKLGVKKFKIVKSKNDDKEIHKLDNCEWDLEKGGWCRFEMKTLEGRKILAIIVSPRPEFVSQAHSVAMDTLSPTGAQTPRAPYILLRNKDATSYSYPTSNTKETAEIIEKHRATFMDSSDLSDFLSKLRDFQCGAPH